MKADQILRGAADLVSGQRARQNGDKRETHQRIADLWTAYLGKQLTRPLTGSEVALMMALLKVARTRDGEHNPDDYTDLAGYGGIAGELADGEQ